MPAVRQRVYLNLALILVLFVCFLWFVYRLKGYTTQPELESKPIATSQRLEFQEDLAHLTPASEALRILETSFVDSVSYKDLIEAARQALELKILRAGKSADFLAPLPDDIMRESAYLKFKEWMDTAKERLGVEEEELFKVVIDAVVSGLQDPYTVLLSPDQAVEFQQDMAGEDKSIGVVLEFEDGSLPTIVAIDETRGAGLSDLRLGQQVVSINGLAPEESIEQGIFVANPRFEVKNNPPWEALQSNWVVRDENDVEQTISFSPLLSEVQQAIIRRTAEGFDWVIMPSFSDQTIADLTDYQAHFVSDPPKAIVIDLRDNAGGLLQAGVTLAGMFLPKDTTIFSIESWYHGLEENQAPNKLSGTILETPVYVIVNQKTASTSEVVASALQDYQRAKVIGQRTYGKGSVQQVFPLQNTYALKVTIGRYLTPKGQSLDRKGVFPDQTLYAEDWDLPTSNALMEWIKQDLEAR